MKPIPTLAVIGVVVLIVVLLFTVCVRVERSGDGQPPTPIPTRSLTVDEIGR